MICMAAMHAGFLTDRHKNELTIKFNQDPKEYLCGNSENECHVNGIKSKSKDYAEKGFTFEDISNACKFFRSKYTGAPIMVDYVEQKKDTKGGWSFKQMPGTDEWYVHNKGLAQDTPIGSKLI